MYLLRQSGHVFTFEEHIKAMLLSLLSANRPWKQIEENIDNLDKVFHEYNPEYLLNESPKVWTKCVRLVVVTGLLCDRWKA